MAAVPRQNDPSPSPSPLPSPSISSTSPEDQNTRQAPSARLQEILDIEDRIEELSDSSADSLYEDMGTATLEEQAHITYLNAVRIPIHDALRTETSETQKETLEIVMPFLEGNPNNFPLNMFGIPALQREKHVSFLKQALGDYPGGFALLDASRPWLVYWSLQGLNALGHDTSVYSERVIETFIPFQHPTGGYGGGPGQLPHLAATYAAILSIVMAGGPTAYTSINRASMYSFLGRMKQPSGGFTMAEGGEEDIRGAYCALVVCSLLHIPLTLPADAPARAAGLTSFTDGLGEWIGACQAFDGGMSAAPGNEAHGAYAFCALACLSIIGAPRKTLNQFLHVPSLVHWLAARQCSPEGGYNGRTNKLVDGCYSHWVGGCWAIVEAALAPPPPPPPSVPSPTTSLPPAEPVPSPSPATQAAEIQNRPALTRYILSAAQFKKGGLIDKPGKRADAYHTCYNLAGLSATQHVYSFEEGMLDELGGSDFDAPFYWKGKGHYGGGRPAEGGNDKGADDGSHDGKETANAKDVPKEAVLWDDNDMVNEVHPIFVIPFRKVHDCRRWFEDGEGKGEL